MSGFNVPKYDSVDREATSLPSKGRHDVTVTSIECKRSKGGDPQMVWTETIDNGADAKQTLKEFFTFKDDGKFTWARLACICDAAGFAWEEASSLEAFAAQFPVNGLRFSVEVDYRYVVEAWIDVNNSYRYSKFTPEQTDETPYRHDINVQEHEWNDWPADQRKGPYAQVRDGFDFTNIYQKPQADRELEFGDSEDDDEMAVVEEALANPTGDGLPF